MNNSLPTIVDLKTIRFPNGKSVEFDYPIGDMIEFGEIIAVRLELDLTQKCPANQVFGYSLAGEQVWQIKTLKKFKRPLGIHAVLSQKRDGQLEIVCNNAIVLYIDPKNGEVVKTGETR